MNARLGVLRVTVATVLATLALAGCTSDSSDSNMYRFDGATKVGELIPIADRKPVPDITAAKLTGGGDYPVTEHANKIVLVNFWATWCDPCVVETPQLDNVYRNLKGDGVLVVGVDYKNFPQSKAQDFVDDHDITYPMVYDEKGEVALQLGNVPATGLPFSVLIDKQGRVAAVYLSVLTEKDLEPVLTTLRGET